MMMGDGSVRYVGKRDSVITNPIIVIAPVLSQAPWAPAPIPVKSTPILYPTQPMPQQLLSELEIQFLLSETIMIIYFKFIVNLYQFDTEEINFKLLK